MEEADSSLKGDKAFVKGSRLLKTQKALPGRYIVVLEDKAALQATPQRLASELAARHGAAVSRVYSHALRGFAAEMPEAEALSLSMDPSVRYVEEDGEVSLDATQTGATWGLDRIDQRDLPLDQTYTYGRIGSGVHAYVIDTGIRITHSEFGGRAQHGYDAIGDGNGSNDCHGHGTHVAGTVGGSTYGVAKGVTLHAVRVLNCGGSGTWSQVIAGVDWVTANHVKPAVANMSLGGGATQSLDDAVTNSINAGVFYAVAAGNESTDACSRSPARTPSAMTIGAADSTDTRAYFSNYGTCVDVFAPGVNITAAWNTSDTGTNTISGTSMASPHVAGAAALYLEGAPTATPQAVTQGLLNSVTPDKVINPGTGSPNRMLYSGCTGTGDSQPPAISLTAPTVGETVSGTVSLAASATDDTGVVRVEFFLGTRLLGSDTSEPFELAWNSTTVGNGSGIFTAKAYDASCNEGASTPVEVTIANATNATFDPQRGAPTCASVGSKCDSVGLLDGRANLGPEPHAPNTLGSACADGTSGTYHSSPSLDRLTVVRSDDTPLAVGKEVTIQATVWASSYYPAEYLDLYIAADANSPSWTLLKTVRPTRVGAHVFSASYLLPSGSMQAIRGVYRNNGFAQACISGSLNDHDDLVFAVGQETDSTPPTVAITSPAPGATVIETVTFEVQASDNFGVARVELYDGATLVGTDTAAPYSLSWNSRTVPNGPRTLTARAYDAAGSSTLSDPVEVIVNNDYVPPEAAFTSPAEGSTVSQTVSLQASASDDRAVSYVDFFLGASIIGRDYSQPYAINWNSRTAANGTHTLYVKAYDTAGNASTQSPLILVVDNDHVPPQVALTSPANGTTVSGTVSMEAVASDDRQMDRVEFFVNGTRVATDASAPFTAAWDSTQTFSGSHTISVQAFDASGNSVSSTITVTVNNPGSAAYDPVLKAPSCATVSGRCDSTSLLYGNGSSGPERNQPNTLDACPDGYIGGGYRTYPSVERIRVSRVNGTALAAGRTARIDVDVWSYSPYSESLVLFYKSDVTQTSWTYLTTIRPTTYTYGLRTYSAEYTLPTGGMQAVRASYRYGSSSTMACDAYVFNDHDDLVFAVFQGPDTTAPEVAITAPATGAVLTGTVSVTATALDDFDVTRVDFYDGATLIGSDTTMPYSVSWNTRTAPNGGHVLAAVAFDAAGNAGTSSSVQVTLDNDFTGPATAITSPTAGATLIRTVMLSATATDSSGVTRVEFYAGTRLLGTDTVAPYSFTWNTQTESVGEYILAAKAYDTLGNESTSAPVTVTVARDSIPPQTAITAPAAGAVLSGSILVTATATDTYQVTRVDFFDGTALLGSDTTAPYSVSWNSRTAPNGSHTLTVVAYDDDGNAGTSAPVQVTLDNDFTAPTTSITNPTSGATLIGAVMIYASASDAKGVTRLELYAGTRLIGTSYSSSPSFYWDTLAEPVGEYVLTTKAYDAAGNVGTSAPVTVTVARDTTPPSVAFTTPTSGAVLEGSVSIRASVADNTRIDRVEFYVDGVLIGSSPYTYAIYWDTKTVENGSHTLTAKAYDIYGNVGTSSGVVVTVNNDRTAPTVSVTAPAEGATVTGSITLTASASDDRSVSRVAFHIDGQHVGTDSSAPFSYSWNSRNVANGSHTVTAKAYDAAGNVGTVDRSFTTDNDFTPPQVTITAPAQGDSIGGVAVIRANATDNQAMSRVQFYVDGTLIGQVYSEPWAVAWDSHLVANGSHTLTATAYDAMGYSTTSAPITVNVYQPGSAVYDPALGVPVCTGEPSICDTASLVLGRGAMVPELHHPNTLDGCADGVGSSWQDDQVSWIRVSHTEGASFTAGRRVRVEARVKSYSSAGYVDVYATSNANAPSWTLLTSQYVSGLTTQGVSVDYLLPEGSLQAVRVSFRRTTSSASPCSTGTNDDRDDLAFAVGPLVDETPPVVAFTSPLSNGHVRGMYILAATATDDSAVTQVEFYQGTTLIGTDTVAPYTADWNTTALAGGAYTITAKAYDIVGHVASAEIPVIVDNLSPTAAFSAPAAGAHLRGTVQLTGTASDNQGIARVEFSIGQTLIGTDTTAPYSVDWDTTGWSGGQLVYITAYDAAGNYHWQARTFTVDNTAPTVAITGPANGSTVALSTTITASAGDNTGVSQVVFYDGTKVLGSDATAPYSFSWNLLLVPRGQHTLTARAYDSAGNVTISSPVVVTVN